MKKNLLKYLVGYNLTVEGFRLIAVAGNRSELENFQKAFDRYSPRNLCEIRPFGVKRNKKGWEKDSGFSLWQKINQ